MKFEIASENHLTLSQVIELRNRLDTRCGISNFVPAEEQYADGVPISGPFSIDLHGIKIGNFSTECRLPKGAKGLQSLKEIADKLALPLRETYSLNLDCEFLLRQSEDRKSERIGLLMMNGKSFICYNSSLPTETRKSMISSIIETCGVPISLVEQNEEFHLITNDGKDLFISVSDGAVGRNPIAFRCEMDEPTESLLSRVQTAVETFGDSSQSSCSWTAATKFDVGADQLIEILNTSQLTIPKGLIGFTYLLLSLESLEKLRSLYSKKGKFKYFVGNFTLPMRELGEMYVHGSAQGYSVILKTNKQSGVESLRKALPQIPG